MRTTFLQHRMYRSRSSCRKHSSGSRLTVRSWSMQASFSAPASLLAPLVGCWTTLPASIMAMQMFSMYLNCFAAIVSIISDNSSLSLHMKTMPFIKNFAFKSIACKSWIDLRLQSMLMNTPCTSVAYFSKCNFSICFDFTSLGYQLATDSCPRSSEE